MYPIIFQFIDDVDYVAEEDYAYGGMGDLTMIAEFTGGIKNYMYHKGIKNRLIDPNSNKFLATGMGNAKKPAMYDAYVSASTDGKVDISKLPEIPIFKKGAKAGQRDEKGVSPTSDIIDAYFLCFTLLTELRLRKGKLAVKDLTENQLLVFNRVTKAFPVNVLAREFLEKK